MRTGKLWWITILSAALAALPIVAQQSTAGVNGTIVDNQGSVIPGATVTLTNTATGVTSRSTTNGSGYYAFVDLTPGEYTMTVTHAGFQKLALPAFHLVVNQTL
ncbi:MAG TPA: carboxypeptidase-like regulatory domain-containing protein, partial [Acidobacteriaceae bacterium]|nr:carboxypeptidase-like regulatory domain-containing protein [Acidobacteriaceae bacterium]